MTMLVGPGKATAARLLPGVDEVIEYVAPWVVSAPATTHLPAARTLLRRLRRSRFDLALVLTSSSQSPLPLALLLRLARIGWVGGISESDAGSLLDLRHRVPNDCRRLNAT